MIEPTMMFRPFGVAGPKVALFGRQTGDWNVNCFAKEGDQLNNTGLFFRLNTLAEGFCFSHLFMPIPTDCNTKICRSLDFKTSIRNGAGRVVLQRGVRADGMILPRGSAGAIASADCPTIIAYSASAKMVIVAHAGSKSIIDVGYFVDRMCPRRENQSVVDEIMKIVKAHYLLDVQVFVTCGIAGKHYRFPEIEPAVTELFGPGCVLGAGLDLKKIIAKQFWAYGIAVTTDTVDTYGDAIYDHCGYQSVWYSYRRGKTPAEKSGRNLVLVVN